MSLTSLILILIGNFFVFIICLTGAQACYFKKRWKWFFLMVACVLISGTCVFIELYQWLAPAASRELPSVFIRQPTTPL
jgi:hypothetical protein